MNGPSIYWSFHLTTGFQNEYSKLSEVDQWRFRGLLSNIIRIKNPVTFYHSTHCKECPPEVHLFGISDNGLGDKGIEIEIWLNRKAQTLFFLKCKKTKK